MLCGGLVDPGPRPAAGYEWSLLDRLVADDLAAAWDLALRCDPVSAFGGIVAANRTLDAAAAERIAAMLGNAALWG